MVLISLMLIVTVTIARNAIPSQAAGASIMLSVTYGPPTTSVRLNGRGFKSREGITVTFDTTQISKTTTSSNGTFSINIKVPSTALPGNQVIKSMGSTSGLTAQAIFLVQTDWVQFGFNRQHTHYNVFENVLNTKNVSTLVLDWSYTAGRDIASSPAVVNGVVYVGSHDDKLYAFNAATGMMLWSYTTNGPILSSPAVVNGVVYIGSSDHTLYALNATTGTFLWSYATGLISFSSPAIANGVIYVGSYGNNTLYALNTASGAFLWSYTSEDTISSSPAVANGVVHVGSDDHTLYAFHLPGTTP